MLKRLMNYLKSLFGIALDKAEDPEVLLAQAQQEMQSNQAKNRERAVMAITQKNQLLALRDQNQKMVDNLQAKAEVALKSGSRDLAKQLITEKQAYETALHSTDSSLAQAEASVEAVKKAVKHEEENIRLKTAQAMAMKTQWKQSQIEISINRAMEYLTVDGSDAAFKRAQDKVQGAVSESSARAELASGRLDNRMAELDDVIATSAADDELSKLEASLGLNTPSAPTARVDLSGPVASNFAQVQNVGR